jgi:4-hydroxybenzoate polyprenyltransferase
LLIVLQLPRACFYEALIAVLVMIIYPFCKRVLHAPQCVLGIAFSMGIPMAFSALAEPMNQTMLILLIINLTWIIAYDTEYALVDRDDDLLIGVRSTAILFGAFDRRIIGLLQTVCHGLWLLLAHQLHASIGFYLIWVLALLILWFQQHLIGLRTTQAYTRAFLSNGWYGLCLWIAIVISC